MSTPSSDDAANHVHRDTTKRNLVAISPFFIVKDLEASVAYYVERLGFALLFKGPPDDVYYAGVGRDGISIMLRRSRRTCCRSPITHGTHGRAGTRMSTRLTPTRSPLTSSGAARHS